MIHSTSEVVKCIIVEIKAILILIYLYIVCIIDRFDLSYGHVFGLKKMFHTK